MIKPVLAALVAAFLLGWPPDAVEAIAARAVLIVAQLANPHSNRVVLTLSAVFVH
jgi:hypothetical protein